MTFNWVNPASEEYTTVFDAIVYDGYQSCQGNIIGMTQGAELPPSYDAMSLDQIASLPFFPLSINDSNPGAPVLEMVTPPAKFGPSFFDENTASCSSGSSGGSDGYDYYCGTVGVCITFQAHICGQFLDFVDVALQFPFSGSLLPPNSSPSNTEETTPNCKVGGGGNCQEDSGGPESDAISEDEGGGNDVVLDSGAWIIACIAAPFLSVMAAMFFMQ